MVYSHSNECVQTIGQSPGDRMETADDNSGTQIFAAAVVADSTLFAADSDDAMMTSSTKVAAAVVLCSVLVDVQWSGRLVVSKMTNSVNLFQHSVHQYYLSNS